MFENINDNLLIPFLIFGVFIAILLFGGTMSLIDDIQTNNKKQPCMEVKLPTFGTGTCPHPDHKLETHAIKPSVCRCSND